HLSRRRSWATSTACWVRSAEEPPRTGPAAGSIPKPPQRSRRRATSAVAVGARAVSHAADRGARTLPSLPLLPPGYRPPAGTPPPQPAGEGGGLNVQGLPIVKPPSGILAAIGLRPGDMLFQTPHGDTPDNVRNHPALKGVTVPKTGQPGTAGVGLMVTKTLVVMGDPQATTTPEHPRGAMLRAYDKRTGQQVGAVFMPAPQSGSPMTYMLDGKQYIVVAVSTIAGQ